MEESILNRVKKFCHLGEDYDVFDSDIIMLINSYLNELNQLGVGVTGFSISDTTSTWKEFLGDDENRLNLAKEFICLNVRMIFDPPAGSAQSAYKERIQELKWRLNVQVDPKVGNAL